MSKTAMIDMTSGSPRGIILRFGVPLLFGLLFQQLYSVIDTYVVGEYLGVDELAAVGSTGAINFMIIGFCSGVCNGFSIPIAQCIGAKDHKNLRKYVANCVWLSVAFSVVITLLVTLLCSDILKLMNTPDNIFDSAYTYIFIIFAGIPATFLYNILSGIIRALGDSKLPLVFLLISSVINVVLDYVTILVFDMGVEGPAIATVISQLISGLLCLVYMVKKFEIIRVRRDEWKFSRHHAYILSKMGVPMGLQYSITAVGSVILQTAVNSLGSNAVAAVTAAGKVSTFLWVPFDAMGATMATYAGQNLGAGKSERVTKGIISCAVMSVVYSAVAMVVIVMFGEALSGIFIENNDPEILHNAWLMLMWTGAFFFLLALVNIIRFSIQGLGYSGLAVLAGVSEMIARAIVGFMLVPKWGYIAVCLANPLAWIMADVFLILAYIKIIKAIKSKFKNSDAMQ